jgi:hypothetical protein
MPGDIRSKERGIVTLTTSGASLSTGSAGAANGTADFDARSTGNFPDDLQAQFELVCQWATVTSIVAGTIAAELYLVPLLDGTNPPDIDLSAGSSRLPYACFAGVFECQKAPTANTSMRFVTGNIPFTHSFTAAPNLLLRQESQVYWGILYQLACFVVFVTIAAKIFTTDRIITLKINFSKTKKPNA